MYWHVWLRRGREHENNCGADNSGKWNLPIFGPKTPAKTDDFAEYVQISTFLLKLPLKLSISWSFLSDGSGRVGRVGGFGIPKKCENQIEKCTLKSDWKVHFERFIRPFGKLINWWFYEGFGLKSKGNFFTFWAKSDPTRPGPADQKMTPKNDGFCLCRTTKMRFLKMVMKIDGFLLWKGRKNSQFLCRVVNHPRSFSFTRSSSPSVQFHEHFSILYRAEVRG